MKNEKKVSPLHGVGMALLGLCACASAVRAEDEMDRYFAHSAEAVEYVKNVMFYAHGFDKKPTDEFQVCWNPNREFTQPADAEPFDFNGTFYSKFDGKGKWDYTKTTPAVWRGRLRLGDFGDGELTETRWVIMRYTMQNDSKGEVWLTNFGLFVDGDDGKKEVVAKVFVNAEEVCSFSQTDNGKTLLAEEKIGALKKGDLVSVCYAPGSKDAVKAIVRFAWMLEDLATGTKPKYRFNIAHPGAGNPVPPLWENGRGGPYYMSHWAVEEQNRRLGAVKDPEVIFLGDSITAAWDTPQFADVRKKMLADKYRVVTLGFSGDWTTSLVFRLLAGDYDKHPAKVYVVMIGTNNISNGYTDDEIVEGNKGVIAAIRRQVPDAKILLLGVFPRESRKGWGINRRIDRINEGLEKLAAAENVEFMNLKDLFFAENGELRRDRLVDGLHPSPAGCEAWAEAINPTILRMLGRQGK